MLCAMCAFGCGMLPAANWLVRVYACRSRVYLQLPEPSGQHGQPEALAQEVHGVQQEPEQVGEQSDDMLVAAGVHQAVVVDHRH